MPFSHFNSAEAVASAASRAWGGAVDDKGMRRAASGRSPLPDRSALKSCAQAARPRSVRIAFCIANDLSARKPSSLRDAVTLLRAVGQREGVGAGDDLFGIGGQLERRELAGRVRRDADAADPRR